MENSNDRMKEGFGPAVLLMTKAELAHYLRLSVRSVSRLMAAGQIPFIKVGATAVRFRLADVLAAIEGGEA